MGCQKLSSLFDCEIHLTCVKMGVHTQGESGFFDEDPDELSAMVQNETIEQHETANASNTVGKCVLFVVCHEMTLITKTNLPWPTWNLEKQKSQLDEIVCNQENEDG